ncbi:PREDICTED: uncharacterized protein LOC109171621 [Ipomoea nil]|uniref:uncharacterized protein LOC109171621 n=1 Tax=Ipomoea nil TaxID=35883 RepID=UPI000901EB90|nr:PREDICTED: uncharacterized protein LOC109171621 [Ipomoea nil]
MGLKDRIKIHSTRRKMQTMKKVHHFLLICLSLISFPFSATSISQEDPVVSYCGKTRIQAPFLKPHPLNSTHSSSLNNLLLCKSNTLYMRTTIGLFQVSAIDYKSKLLTLPHSSCSTSSQFLSPHHLSAGFPSPLEPNSLLLFNCSNQTTSTESPLLHSCRNLKPFKDSHSVFCAENPYSSSCLVVDDVGEMGKDFHPKQLGCTHYRRVYRTRLAENEEVVGLGTRISFDVHVPNPCDECRKPYGNCGVGLKCICHISECKDKVINGGSTPTPSGSIIIIFFSLGLVVAFMNLF